MEFLLAGSAGHFGQGVEGAVDDTETDHAVIHTGEMFIQVTLP